MFGPSSSLLLLANRQHLLHLLETEGGQHLPIIRLWQEQLPWSSKGSERAPNILRGRATVVDSTCDIVGD